MKSGNTDSCTHRVGFGMDVHRLVEGRKLILGGISIPSRMGLEGHSDADVLLHAMSDALLGAAGLGDIGQHFPDTDPRYKDASSLSLLEHVGALLTRHGYHVVNIDSTVLLEQPKVAPHAEAMRIAIARALGIQPDRVSIKATTNEGLGEIGRGEAAVAYAVALVSSR
ncbi:MAG: 2-C-methyl-D-erythritol 2,4-cyclodiphosphate synthase [Bacteroidota bacterium]